MELLIPLDLKAKTALYEQIYAYIRREIRNGSLKAEERPVSYTHLLKECMSSWGHRCHLYPRQPFVLEEFSAVGH